MYTIPIPDRKAWQKLRDTANVPKGAAKASIGADIEAVYKTFTLATMSKNLEATKKLIADLDDSYLPAIRKKYQAFEATVNSQVKNKAAGHRRFVEAVIHGKAEYYPTFKSIETAYNKIVKNQGGKIKDLEQALDRMQQILEAFAMVDEKTWKGRRQGVNRLKADISQQGAVTDGHKQMYATLMADLKAMATH